MPVVMNSIGYKAAVAYAETGWWKNKTAREIVQFQLFTNELCMDFADFQKAVEEVLGRPVYTHEFGSVGCAHLQKEFLGEAPPPTLDDIVALLPNNLHIIVVK